MSILATIKYDFGYSAWVAVLDDDDMVQGMGDTPEAAIEALRHQANKHNLWPKK